MKNLLVDLSFEYDKLRSQVIMPAEGFIKHDYLVPGGFYKQMWDWDGFFIGCHLATRSRRSAEYLKWWVMQSGADNNPALTNNDADRSAILACDMNVFQLREYIAMAHVAAAIGQEDEAARYEGRADRLQQDMLQHLWFQDEGSFFNVRRDTGSPIKRVSYSNFVPLMSKVAPEADGSRMIRQYLWNRDHMLSEYGLRSLSKQDDAYNNDNIIIPYSNWRGPVWPIANYLYFIGLKNYGFDDEAAQLADTLGALCLADIRSCGSMHENYHADTGEPLAPTAEQSVSGVFTGFVGWNLLVQNMLEGVIEGAWLLLEL